MIKYRLIVKRPDEKEYENIPSDPLTFSKACVIEASFRKQGCQVIAIGFHID